MNGSLGACVSISEACTSRGRMRCGQHTTDVLTLVTGLSFAKLPGWWK